MDAMTLKIAVIWGQPKLCDGLAALHEGCCAGSACVSVCLGGGGGGLGSFPYKITMRHGLQLLATSLEETWPCGAGKFITNYTTLVQQLQLRISALDEENTTLEGYMPHTRPNMPPPAMPPFQPPLSVLQQGASPHATSSQVDTAIPAQLGNCRAL